MEAESSSPFSQKPATGPYPEPDESSTHTPPYFCMIHFDTPPHMSKPPKWSSPFRFPE
jgi:hypothetical protein